MNLPGLLPPQHLEAVLLTAWMSVWLVIGLFCYLNRRTRQRHFTIWTAAWLFYALWLTLQIRSQGGETGQWMTFLQLSSIALSTVGLIWGSAEYFQKTAKESLLASFTAFLISWSWVGTYTLGNEAGPLAVEMPLFALIGLASIATAIGFFIRYYRNRQSGSGLAGAGFLVWGLQLLGFPFARATDALVCTGYLSATVVHWFIAVSMIILTLEQVHAERQALRRRVNYSEAKYEGLFRCAREAVVITDRQSLEILAMNHAAESLFHLSKAEARDLRLSQILQRSLPAQDRPVSAREWFNYLVRPQWHRLLREGGKPVSMEVDGAEIHFADQPAFQFVFREAPCESRLERQLRESDKRATAAGMITGMAHELNEPLSVMSGYIELLLKHADLPDGAQRHLAKTEAECRRASRLVQNFLSLARPRPEGLASVDLNDAVRRILELRHYDLNEVDLILDLDPMLPRVDVDMDQAHQVLMDVVANALQAMKSASRPSVLRIATRRHDQSVQVLIEDSGPGVPPQLADRIFEPFFTTGHPGAGPGLGLSIARGIMREHQGRIELVPSSLGGAAFAVDFPRIAMDYLNTAETGESPASNQPAVPKPTSSRQARILVLDDETSLAEMIAEMLSLRGNEALVAHSSKDALKLIEAHEFDAILADYRMPRMDGRMFYQALSKAKPELVHRIIYLTGDILNEETQRFLKSCGRPFVTKPFNFATIDRILKEIIAMHSRSDADDGDTSSISTAA